jgi:hypothetical protein
VGFQSLRRLPLLSAAIFSGVGVAAGSFLTCGMASPSKSFSPASADKTERAHEVSLRDCVGLAEGKYLDHPQTLTALTPFHFRLRQLGLSPFR